MKSIRNYIPRWTTFTIDWDSPGKQRVTVIALVEDAMVHLEEWGGSDTPQDIKLAAQVAWELIKEYVQLRDKLMAKRREIAIAVDETGKAFHKEWPAIIPAKVSYP